MYWLKPLFLAVPFLATVFAASVEKVTEQITMINEQVADHTTQIEAFPSSDRGTREAIVLHTNAYALFDTMKTLTTTIQETPTAEIRTNVTALAAALEQLALQTKTCLTAIAEKKNALGSLGLGRGFAIVVLILQDLRSGAANIQDAMSSHLNSPEDVARSEALGTDIREAFNGTIAAYSQ